MYNTFCMIKILVSIVIALVVVVAGGAYYFVTKIAAEKAALEMAATIAGAPAPAPFATTTRPVAYAVINIYKGYFDPATITIKKGTQVIWKNTDAVTHTVTSDEGGLILNSQAIAAGHSFAHLFTEVGTITYHCAIYPKMTSTVIVTD